MLRERKFYLVNLANLSSVKDEDIGLLGVTLRSLLSQNINIPFGFILTTSSFDDFLIANDLVDFIGSRINEPDYNDFDQITKNSKQIQEAILNARFPDLIREPIEKAYQGLSGFAQANVSLRVSVNNKDLIDSLNGSTLYLDNVYGIDNLYLSIKQLWAEFFSPSAILHRGKIGYEGYLTESIVVQRSMQAEVSGRLFSVNPTDNDPEFVEIQAIWGMELPEGIHEITPDSYYFSKESSQLVEKKIISQEYMYVRKARYDERDPFMKVQISKMWQKKQKLDNKYLFQLFHYALTLERTENKSFELQWVLESGKISITGVREMYVPIPVEEKYPIKTEGFISTDINDFDGSSVVITPQEQMEKYVEEINSEVSENKDTSKLDADVVIAQSAAEDGKLLTEDSAVDIEESFLDIGESLVPQSSTEKHLEKIQEMAKDISEGRLIQEQELDMPVAVEKKSEKGIVVAPEVEKSFEVKAPVEEKKVVENLVVEKPAEIEKIEVDIKPIKDLKTIVKGESGQSKDVTFGILKVVKKSFDLEDLTGDEILAFDNITFRDIEFINKVRGAVVQGIVYSDLLKLIAVPVIYGNSKLLEQVVDNSVVTIDGENGKLFTGAGIKNGGAALKNDVVIDVPHKPTETIVEEPEIEDEIVKKDELMEEKSKEVAPHEDIFEKNIEAHDEVKAQAEVKGYPSEIFAPPSLKTEAPQAENVETAEISEKNYSVSIDEKSDNHLINSSTEFWQIIDSRRIILDLKNAKGIFIPFDEIYKIIGMDLKNVLSDSKEQKDFIKRCVNLINEVIEKSGNLQVMLLSASRNSLVEQELESRVDDLINIDLEVLSILRNEFGFRNIWYGFNDISNVDELTERKKNVTSEGMRRSVSFKLFAVLNKSYPLFGIKSIVENNNIDGIIIDLDGLVKDFAGGKGQMDDIVVNLLKYVLSFVNTNNKLVFILNFDIAILPQHIKQLLDAGMTHFVTASKNLMNFKLNFVDQEVSRIERRKKRGRKKKVIDFGF